MPSVCPFIFLMVKFELMKINSTSEKLEKIHTDAVAVILFEGEKPSGKIADLDKALSNAISETIRLGEFKGRLYETTSIFTHKKIPSTRVLLVGGGNKNEFDSRLARNVAGAGAKRALKIGVKKLAVYLEDEGRYEEIIEGVYLATFDPGLYKTKKEDAGEIEELTIVGKLNDETKKHAIVVSESTNWVRKMINEPANMMTPAKMVEEARIIAKEYKFKLEVFNESEAGKKGMGAFVGIAKGSEEPSYFVALEYRGGGKKTLGVVGKGITFDSGGISIKPSEKMHEMKMDMSGAAAVLGFMKIVGEVRPKINVVAALPLTENLPGGRALKPGDVLKSFSGKTIEIINTDAEGRVVLADGLSYAVKLGATHIVDLATLTGAVIVALGDQASGILGRPKSWVEQVADAAKNAGERVWQFPIYPEHKELLKSEVADIANIPPKKGAGVIAGAVFLQEFVPEKTSWVHLDIAGTSWLDGERPYLSRGPTGVGLRTLVKLMEGMERES